MAAAPSSSFATGGRPPTTTTTAPSSSSSGGGIGSMFGAKPWHIGVAAGVAAVGTTAAILLWSFNNRDKKKQKKKSLKETKSSAAASSSSLVAAKKKASSPVSSRSGGTSAKKASKPQPDLIDDDGHDEGEEVNATDDVDHDDDDDDEEDDDEKSARTALQLALLDPSLLTSSDVRDALATLYGAMMDGMRTGKTLDPNTIRPYIRVLAAYSAWLIPMVDGSVIAFPEKPDAAPSLLGMCTDQDALHVLDATSPRVRGQPVSGWAMFQPSSIGDGISNPAGDVVVGGLMMNPGMTGKTVVFQKRYFPFLNSVSASTALEHYIYRTTADGVKNGKPPASVASLADIWILGVAPSGAAILQPEELKGAGVFQCWSAYDLMPKQAIKSVNGVPRKVPFMALLDNCITNKCGIYWNAPIIGLDKRVIDTDEPDDDALEHATWHIQQLLPSIRRHWTSARVRQVLDIITKQQEAA